MFDSSEEIDNLSEDDFLPQNIPAVKLKEHVESLQKLDMDETALEIEFERIEIKSVRDGITEEFQTASNSENRTKNRYANVLAPEKTRVKLSSYEGTDYINANYISGMNGSHTYIASQGPLKHTTNDFWKMVWEEKCDTIVMLTKIRENGRHKCHEYWPARSEIFGNFKVKLLDTGGDDNVIERHFLMKDINTKEERKILHIQYASWPDHGLPTNTNKFRETLRIVDNNHKPDNPVLVHCSAGIGRTGTFCVVDTILRDIKEKGVENCNINLPDTVLRLRKERTGMVQTRVQYEFCYLVILEEIESILKEKQKSDSESSIQE